MRKIEIAKNPWVLKSAVTSLMLAGVVVFLLPGPLRSEGGYELILGEVGVSGESSGGEEQGLVVIFGEGVGAVDGVGGFPVDVGVGAVGLLVEEGEGVYPQRKTDEGGGPVGGLVLDGADVDSGSQGAYVEFSVAADGGDGRFLLEGEVVGEVAEGALDVLVELGGGPEIGGGVVQDDLQAGSEGGQARRHGRPPLR